MLKETRTYTDFNGVERTEDFYFNMTEAELMELELGTTGGLSEMINKITATKDAPQIIAIFKKIVLLAYGEKSADGRRFAKSDEIREGFAQTQAYSDIFMELATNEQKATAFIKGIMPEMKDNKSSIPAPTK